MNLIIDTDLRQTQCFVEMIHIRELNEYDELIKNKILFTNMDNIKSLINAYKDNERFNKYTSKKKERRYGALFKILLPKEKIEPNKLVKIVSKFARFVVQEEKGLKYFSFLEDKKEIRYLNVVFLDREYYCIDRYKTYPKTMYRNKVTKIICGSTSPEAELVCTAGSIVKDENGINLKEQIQFKERKTRKFIYEDGDFAYFIDKFKRFWTQALGTLKSKLINGKFIRRLNLRRAWNRFERRIILANNWLIQYIQNQLNELFQLTVRDITWYDIHKGSTAGEIMINKEKYELVEKKFEKYRKIFTSGKFVIDEKGYKIQKIQCDQAESNLKILRVIFESDYELLKSRLIN